MLLLSGEGDDDGMVYDSSSPPQLFSSFIFDFSAGDDCELCH